MRNEQGWIVIAETKDIPDGNYLLSWWFDGTGAYPVQIKDGKVAPYTSFREPQPLSVFNNYHLLEDTKERTVFYEVNYDSATNVGPATAYGSTHQIGYYRTLLNAKKAAEKHRGGEKIEWAPSEDALTCRYYIKEQSRNVKYEIIAHLFDD